VKIHFTGIAGTGMGAVAGLMKQLGEDVRGSDLAIYPPMSDQLSALGIVVFDGFSASNLDWQPDLVVLGNRCSRDHVEYVAAEKLGIPVVSFPRLLNQRILFDRDTVIICGTHGKTTTTSIMTHVLRSCGIETGYLVGGIPKNFGRSYDLGKAPYFVIEGDEYDCACFDKRPKFVHYRPRTVILTGIEFDHADIYDSIDDVKESFRELITRIPSDGLLVVNAESEVAMELSREASCRVQSYAVFSEGSEGYQRTRKLQLPLTWSAAMDTPKIRTVDGLPRTMMTVSSTKNNDVSIELPMVGEYNLSNALAVIATGSALGLHIDKISQAIGSFQGIKRRQELRYKKSGVFVIDDFAHHPTAIKGTLSSLRSVYGDGKLVALFEPRSATTRRDVFQTELAQALSEADMVYFPPFELPRGVSQSGALDPQQLQSDLENMGITANYLPVDEIVTDLAAKLTPDDTVVVMSSGSFGGVIEKLEQAL